MPDDRFSPTAKPLAGTADRAEPPPDAGRPPLPEGATRDERTLAVMCHVGGFLTAFVVPLVLWLAKRRDSAFVDRHGKEAINFQLTLMVVFAVILVSDLGIAI